MTTLLVVLGLFLFSKNNRFSHIAATWIIGSAVYLVAAVVVHRPPIGEILMLTIAFALVNVMCFSTINHLNRLRRLQYANLRYHERLEQELSASERLYRELVEGANSVVVRFDTNGVIRFVNNYGLRFFGFEAEELIGKNIKGTIAWCDGRCTDLQTGEDNCGSCENQCSDSVRIKGVCTPCPAFSCGPGPGCPEQTLIADGQVGNWS